MTYASTLPPLEGHKWAVACHPYVSLIATNAKYHDVILSPCQLQTVSKSEIWCNFGVQDPDPATSVDSDGGGLTRPNASTFGPAAAAAMRASQQGGIGIGGIEGGFEPLDADALDAMCNELGVPQYMRDRFLRLAVLQPNLPIPMSTLVSLTSYMATMTTVMTTTKITGQIKLIICMLQEEDVGQGALVIVATVAPNTNRAHPYMVRHGCKQASQYFFMRSSDIGLNADYAAIPRLSLSQGLASLLIRCHSAIFDLLQQV